MLVRLITYADTEPAEHLAVRVRQVVQLDDGRELDLQEDRLDLRPDGATVTTVEDVVRGRIEPAAPSRTRHFAQLAAALRVVGVPAGGEDLAGLPNVVLLSPSLRAKLRS